MRFTKEQIASALDLAVLKPTATVSEVEGACGVANRNKIKSVCVAPAYVPVAAKLFDNVSCVVGFPHGNHLPAVKIHEARLAIDCGAREIDVVTNYGRFLDGDSAVVAQELSLITLFAKDNKVTVKAILETCYYTDSQIRQACKMCVECGVDFVKSSTGFGRDGALPSTVQVMLDSVAGTGVQVKASGGIINYYLASLYLSMGCTRLGSSYFHAILPMDDNQCE
jgi:deoxyribose-phosphate aldolase